VSTSVEAEQVLKDLIHDPDELRYVKAFMKIPNKQRQDVPFIPYPVQQRLIDNHSNRDVWVKDSQCGSTSIVSSVMLKRTITHPNTTTVIMAHDEFTTQRLLHRVQVFYDSIHPSLKPEMDHRSAYEKRFPDINSVIYISTARSQVAGRGEPIHNLLFSEAGFYVPEARERIIIPALQRVPPDGWVVIESTPNGQDAILYEEVQRVIAGDSVFKMQTVFWWDNPDNWLPVNTPLAMPDEDRRITDYSEEEEELILAHGLSEDQVRWRRYKIRESGEMFFQEHMESLDSCFLVTGRPFYPPDLTIPMSRECYPAPHTGPQSARMWFDREDKGRYVMGVDPGQGKTTKSVASVWRVWPPPVENEPYRGPQHVCKISDWIEPITFAPIVRELAEYYNMAFIVLEANSHGVGLVALLRNYPNLYWREDIVSGKKSSVIGWYTSPSTKPFMMQQFKAQLPHLEIRDAELMSQIRGFREEADRLGHMRAVPTTLDDDHDAACLAIIGVTGAILNPNRGFKGGSGFTSWDR